MALRYVDTGSGEPVLVFLHAFPLNRRMWDRQVEALAGRVRVVAPDLPGFGESDLSPNLDSMDAYADAVAGLLDTLGIQRALFCGLSMGGYIAFALWRRHRERVAGLVLADTRAAADSEAARHGRLELIERLRVEGSGAALGSLPRLVGQTTRSAQPALLDQLRSWILANPPEGVAAAARAMAGRPDSTPLLPGISVPVQVIVGEEDELTPPAESEQIAAAIPGAQLARIPKAGHLSALEQPEAFNGALKSFMSRFVVKAG